MNIEMSDYLKKLILNGEKHTYFKEGLLIYDELCVYKDKVEFKYDGAVLGILKIPHYFDLNAGDTLTINLGESKNRIQIQ